MDKRIIFITSGWIVFAMRFGFAGVMVWASTDVTNQALQFTLIGLAAIFFGNAISQIIKMYDFLKKVDTLNLTID
jgi:hypothetical protein